MDRLAGTIVGLVFFAIIAGAYFAPTITAGLRQHHQLGPIAIINFFLGWTLIGWVVALAMAASNTKLRGGPQPVPGSSAWPPSPVPSPAWPSQHGEPPQERSA